MPKISLKIAMENNKTHYSKEEIEAKIKGLLTMDLSKFKVVEEKEELFASKKYDVSLIADLRARQGCASSGGNQNLTSLLSTV